MSRPPNRYSTDAKSIAEAAFKKATTKPVEMASPAKPASPPGAKEAVSIRIDVDVLEHFQKDGAGWQDRINQVLRRAAGLG